MKYVALVALFFVSLASAEDCGCKTKIVNVHEHEAMECEENEVMVGHDMENGVVMCGTIQCDCACKPLKDYPVKL